MAFFESAFESTLPYPLQIRLRACDCIESIPGWCSREKAACFIDLILTQKVETIVEIGVFGGQSLLAMAVALDAKGTGTIFGIDPWNAQDALAGLKNPVNRSFWAHVNYRDLLEELTSKIEEWQLHDRIVLIQKTSMEADPIENIDLLHIDGSASQELSRLDAVKWTPLVRSGGWIVLSGIDRYKNEADAAAPAICWLNEHCILEAVLQSALESWAIWKKP